ncbi:hypothetical protein FB567DRAFT_589206 [Paraphoma chrysanthemicola]|uniref:F-box domain-containing protein n=1 Tax=Paraphoma chrysanthemicola TaxID=798071 RepID=A0A8K0W2J6_9PLEO|nr:hypothetical protein FB567DRAFT_589206 [Paraphoma chrysanthemicola]
MPSPPIPRLPLLPTELKSLIFAHLSSKSLLALSSTCRDLHAVALPLAYAHVTLMWDDSPSQRANAPRLNLFLRTLIGNPHVARAIKRLDLRAKQCMYSDDDGRFLVTIPGLEACAPSAAELTSFHAAIHDLGMQGVPNWDEDSEDPRGAFFLMLVLILAHCSRLEELEMSVVFVAPNTWHEWFEDLVYFSIHNGGQAQWMSNLKKFTLRCDTSAENEAKRPGFMQIDKRPLWAFYLPAVEEVVLEHFEDPVSSDEMLRHEESPEAEDWRVHWWPWACQPMCTYPPKTYPHSSTLAPSCSYLTTLRLKRCSAEARTLELLLRYTPVLKVLELDLFRHPYENEFDLNVLRQALGHVAQTLERLTVRYEVFPETEYGEIVSDMVRVTTGRLCPLTPFAQLTDLEISLHTLFGSDDSLNNTFFPLAAVLPPKLQELVVTDDLYGFSDWQQYFEDGDAMAMFRRYLEGGGDGEGEWRVATPELRRFVYDLRERGEYSVRYWDREERREELMAMCKGQGLEGEVLWSY